MKVRYLCFLGAACLGFAGSALANNVVVTTPTPINITYHVAHVNGDSHPVYSELRSMKINQSSNIAAELNGYERSGIVIVAVNGHALPDNINQFNQPKQCSMTTDVQYPSGTLDITLSEHAIKCATRGGVFG